MSLPINVTGIIISASTAFRDRKGIASFEDVNDGYCDQCAEEIVAALWNHAMINARVVASWLDPFWNPLKGSPEFFDQHSESKFFTPQRRDLIIDVGHAWVHLNGRHYDCEAPSGVDNPLDLPFYVREIASLKRRESLYHGKTL